MYITYRDLLAACQKMTVEQLNQQVLVKVDFAEFLLVSEVRVMADENLAHMQEVCPIFPWADAYSQHPVLVVND